MFPDSLIKKAQKLQGKLAQQHQHLALAESCTGGLLSALVTSIPGSSQVFRRGFVTYTGRAKHEILGIPRTTLDKYGEVSPETGRAMAQGALDHSNAHYSAGITGIAGPDGRTEEKPVGLVYVVVQERMKKPVVHECHFSGDRQSIRLQAVEKAIDGLLALM